MNLTIGEISYHRNGIGGEPFYVVAFRDNDEQRNMVAVLFSNDDREGFVNPRTAVFDRDLIIQTVSFGENSWRGDRYDEILRPAVQKHAGSDYPECFR